MALTLKKEELGLEDKDKWDKMNIIFLGAPGSGKGTQAQMLSKELDIPQISTGDALRKEVQEQSEVGKLAKSYMDAGDLVPDEVVVDIIKNRIVDKMDHKNLNLEVDFMKDTITTAENIAIKIYEELESDIQATGNNLYSVKLYETENNYVEYYG